MREIKFRAWDIRRQVLAPVLDLKWLQVGNYRLRVNASHGPDDYIPMLDGEYELMQFTGLTDKNGVEIYEGDILRFPNRPYYKNVRVAMESGAYRLFNPAGSYLYPLGQTPEVEVIGNIYENADLLEATS